MDQGRFNLNTIADSIRTMGETRPSNVHSNDAPTSCSTLAGLPGELFQQIVAEMINAVGVRYTTALRLVNKDFDSTVIYLLLKGDVIHKKHTLEGICKKCQIPGSLMTKFLMIQMRIDSRRESPLGRIVDEVLNRYEEIQRSCSPGMSLTRQDKMQILLESIAERVPLGKIMDLGKPQALDTSLSPKSAINATKDVWCFTNEKRAHDIMQGMFVLSASLGDISSMIKMASSISIIDSTSEFFTTALYAASRRGQVEAVELLLQSGAEAFPLNAASFRNKPLGAACYGGHEMVVRMLWNQPADTWLNYSIQCEESIRLALKGGHDHLINILLEKRQSSEHIDPMQAVSNEDVLLIAASCGSTEVVRKLLDAGTDINTFGSKESRSLWRRNALQCAAVAGRLNVVKMLLERGSKKYVTAMNDAFVLAVREQRGDVAKFLLEQGADINHVAPRPNHWRRYGTALMTAASHADEDMVRFLFTKGVHVHKAVPANKEDQGSCALTSACRRGHANIARILLQNGVDPNKSIWSEGKGGKPNLYYAKKSGEPGIVEVLIEFGAVPGCGPT